jgi:hypothetical protein
VHAVAGSAWDSLPARDFGTATALGLETKTPTQETSMKPFTTHSFAALVALGLALAAVPRSQADVNLWPILEVSEKETTFMYPFYVNEPRFKMIFPFYYKANESRDTHLLWPLVKFHDGKLERAAPFYFRDHDNYTFFPFIRQTDRYTLWFLPPMYFDKDGDFSAVVPLYIRSNESMFLFPNTYWHRNDDAKVDHWHFWPLMTGDSRDGNEYSRVLNYAHSKKRDREWWTFFPLYFRGKSTDEDLTWMFPYFSHKSDESHERCLVPLFHAADKSYKDGSSERTRNYLWPIYRNHEERNPQGEVITRDRRFLIFSDSRSGNRRTMRVFGIPISERIE